MEDYSSVRKWHIVIVQNRNKEYWSLFELNIWPKNPNAEPFTEHSTAQSNDLSM